VIHSQSFQNEKNAQPFKSAVYDVYQKYVLLLGKSDGLEYSVLKNEEKDAWTQYMKKGQIKQALENCQSSEKPFVAGIYADQLFLKKKYSEAAKYYAQSSKTFEEVSLRFIQENLYDCLIEYLEQVLDSLLERPNQEALKPYKLLLSTWIVELKVNELNSIQAKKDDEKLAEAEQDKCKAEYQIKLKAFRDFLKKTKDMKNVESVFQVLQSHGKIDECIRYAEMIERYDTVIVHYINKQEHAKALQKVTSIADEGKRNETMLRYASIFLNKCAKETIKELQSQYYRKIDIPKLMPAFMNIHDEQDQIEALNYITNYCIIRRSSRSKTVHNMAFFFHSKINDSEKLIRFLESEEAKKSKGHPIYFEVDYALNVCK